MTEHFNSPHDDSLQHRDAGQLELFSVAHPEHNQPAYEYEQLSDPDLRYKYVRYTEGLIARTIAEQKDTLIFLDKSARPVAWLMRALWPTLGFKDFDENGEPIPVKMPEMKFVNFDREQWAAVMGRSEGKEGKGITLEALHPDTVDSLTGLFAVESFDADDYVSEADETMFDDKNILIVDEVSASGDTLRMAEKIFDRAFRNARSIEGTHWMSPEKKMDKRSGGMRNADLPIWYDSSTPFGRLVGDRDLYRSSQSLSVRQRRGAQFLSYRLPEVDVKGRQLRKEMQQLGAEVANGDMPVILDAAHRPDDDDFVEHYMNHVNHLSTREFAQLRGFAERQHVPFPSLVYEYKQIRDSSTPDL